VTTSSNPAIIEVQGIGKTFRVYQRPLDRLRERFTSKRLHYEHQALIDISFNLSQGDALAILGANGAGKSTLLKLITGVLLPDTGHIRTSGRIAGLLELGTGFDANLTGRQNIWTNAALLGLHTSDIEAIFEDIIAFSELGQYLDAPVRTYSSGMVMRLGFSIAIHARPACFVIDEALSVGDARFQQKCLLKIQAFRQSGGSLLFVSHDLNAVKVLCDRAIVLDKGRVSFDGPPQEACLAYQKQLMQIGSPSPVAAQNVRYGQSAIRISGALLENSAGHTRRFVSGDPVTLKVQLTSEVDTSTLALGFMVRDRLGQDLFGTNTHLHQLTLNLGPAHPTEISFVFTLHLGPGQYTITLGLHDKDNYTEDVQDWWNDSLQFDVDYKDKPNYVGVCPLPVHAIHAIHAVQQHPS
jgi:lipopolysaccharide transport system ATP-binding protein